MRVICLIDDSEEFVQSIDSIPGSVIDMSYGTSEEMTCRYIDDTHVEFNGGEGPYNLQHICQFAEQLEKIGAKVVPVTEPMTLFKQRLVKRLLTS